MRLHPDLTSEFNELLRNKIRLPQRIDAMRSVYQNSQPFRHLVIDDLFSQEDLDSLLVEMANMRPDQWASIDQDPRERTARMRSATEMGPAGERLLSIVHSAGFLYLISEITGIGQLLPDPYLKGAGYASMRRGDYFNVHSDRNMAYDTGLARRLGMIIFLNKSWRPEYHGQLELWSDDGKRCEARIDPLFNRTVLLEVANPNFHGVPKPLACPPDRLRRSFILYYHTVGSGDQTLRPHSSVFAPRFYGSNRLTLRSLFREVTPPFLKRAMRKWNRYDP